MKNPHSWNEWQIGREIVATEQINSGITSRGLTNPSISIDEEVRRKVHSEKAGTFMAILTLKKNNKNFPMDMFSQPILC